MELAREHLAGGEVAMAREKGCGAAGALVQAIAEGRGWKHRNHRDLFICVRQLGEEAGDPEVVWLFGLSEALRNGGTPDVETVALWLNGVERFLDKLDPAPLQAGE